MTLDIDTIRSKYAEERDKRVRTDGNEQYVEIAGKFAHYKEDPYIPVKPRAPVTDHVTFAFIGGGWCCGSGRGKGPGSRAFQSL